MTISLIRTINITGADLSGTQPDTDRTYTLSITSGSSLQTDSVEVSANHAVLHNGVGYDFTVSSNTITFLNAMYDSMVITIRWVETSSASSVAGNNYADTLTVMRLCGLGIDVLSENVGTGNSSETDFSLDHDKIVASSYTLYHSASGSNDFTDLTETTHYSIDKDTGKILLTAAGVTALGTDILYADYVYSTYMKDSELETYLARADEEVDRMTGRTWGTPGTNTYYFDGRRSNTYPTTDEPYARDWDEKDEVQLPGNVTEVNYVYFLKKNAIFQAVYSNDGGSYTDNTDEANSLEGTAFPVFATTPADDDEIYFGSTYRFFGMTTRLATLGVDSGSTVVTWYYYNGTTWTSFTPTAQTSGADDFTASGRLTWDYLDAWEKTTVNSSGSMYFIKAVLSTSSYSTAPTIRYVSLDNDSVVDEEVSLSAIDWDSTGRITFLDNRIPNGNRIVKVVCKLGETTTNPLIPELAAMVCGLMAFAKVTGSSIDTPSTYTMPEGSVSVGQLYVNVESVAKSFRRRIDEIMKQLGERISIEAI